MLKVKFVMTQGETLNFSSEMTFDIYFKNGKVNKGKEKTMMTTVKRMEKNLHRQYPNAKLKVTFEDIKKEEDAK